MTGNGRKVVGAQGVRVVKGGVTFFATGKLWTRNKGVMVFASITRTRTTNRTVVQRLALVRTVQVFNVPQTKVYVVVFGVVIYTLGRTFFQGQDVAVGQL